MEWPASDASVYAMIPFRKLRRSVSTENGDIARDYNADTTPVRIGVSRTAIYGHILVLGTQSETEPPAKWGYLGTSLAGPTRELPQFPFQRNSPPSPQCQPRGWLNLISVWIWSFPLFITDSLYGVERCGTTRGKPASDQTDRGEQSADDEETSGI